MGQAGGFGRGHYMPHDYNQPFRNRLATGSYYMDPEEIDSILRIQWKSLHSGSPYVEDYYYLVSQLQSLCLSKPVGALHDGVLPAASGELLTNALTELGTEPRSFQQCRLLVTSKPTPSSSV